MTEGREGRAACRQKSAEFVVAALFFLVGAIVIYDSQRLGSSWGSDGPQPGYFPFYVGLIMCIASVANILRALALRGEKNRPFVLVGQLRLVLSVLIPTAIYASLVTWTGIYVASILFIGLFMRWLGKYPWWKVVAVSLGAAIVFYLVFEVWFKVPLPKGPLEALLGLD
jgi:hypothetical protein